MTLFALVGCDNKDEFDQIVSNNPEASELPQTLYATILNEEDAQDTLQSRTYLNSNRKVVWHAGDEISFFSKDTHGHYVSKGKDGDEHVVFDFLSETTVSVANPPLYSLAVYPYDETITCERENNQDKLHVTYPATQTYAANSFAKGTNLMVSAGTIPNGADNNLRFRNACGYLVLKLYGHNTKVKTVTLSSRTGNEKIAGAGTIVAKSNAVPVITMADDASPTVTLNCGNEGVAIGADAANATEFWLMLPPVTFEGGIKVEVTDVNDITYTKETTKSITVTRNSIKPMAPFEFVASNKIWYTKVADSGTGPITFYNGMTNPFDATIKAHYYDSSAGKYVIEFQAPVKTIKENAFRESAIKTIELPDGLQTIEKGAFNETQLAAITIPGSVETIKTEAFYACRQLETIEFLPSPTQKPLTIACRENLGAEYGPFEISYFKSINLNRDLVYVKPNGNSFAPDEVDEGIFYNINPASVTVTIGDKVETIPDYMFSGLKINHLTIPGTVTTIGNDVFNGCTALTSLTFLPSPTGEALTLGYNTEGEEDGPFLDSPLTTVNLNREIIYTLENIDLDYDDEGIFSGRPLTGGVNIGEQVRTLSPYMFSNSGITSLTIPNTLETVKKYAFNGCTSLGTVNIKDGTNPLIIEYYAPFINSPLTNVHLGREVKAKGGNDYKPGDKFSGLLYTTVDYDDIDDVIVTISDHVQTIYPYTFSYLKLKSITIPASVTLIRANAFTNCKYLNTIVFAESSTPLQVSCMNANGINQGPFHDTSLTSITLGREISYCNDGSGGLVDFVPTATDQGLFSFQYDAESLSVTLSNNVQTISNYMFIGTNIESIIIPSSVTTIGNGAFGSCFKLASIRFEGSATPLTIGFQPGPLEVGPFYDSPLTSIYVNRELVASQEYAAARDEADEGIFSTSGNSRNVTVTLQGNVNTISDYMFSGVNMQTIWIPREVTSIGKMAFKNCSQLYGMTLAHQAHQLPPTLSEKAFEGTLIDDPNVKNRWIALEYGYEEKVLLKFKSAPYWKEYAAIIIPQIKNP